MAGNKAARDRFIRSVVVDWSKIDEGSWLREIPAIAGLTRLDFDCPVTLLAGENGTGKSTLLEAVAVCAGFNAEGGTFNYRFSTYDDLSELAEAMSLVRGARRPRSGYFFRAESFYNVATAALTEYNYDGMMPDYHVQSHGESFLAFMGGARPDGLYLMDEPEAALSPQRQLALLIRVARLAAEGAQFIIATHSPILLGLPDAAIFSFDDGGIRPCAYEDTGSYRITRLFLENREGMLARLLEGDS